MSEFINKAKNNNNFNNYGQTVKVNRKSYSNTKNKNNTTTNGIGNNIPLNNKQALESKIDIETKGSNAKLAQQATIDSSTGYPPCPPGQSRVPWAVTADSGGNPSLSVSPLPDGSNNFSRLSECGCWVDTGLSLTDILGVAAADTLFGLLARGSAKGLAGTAIEALFEGLKKSTNFNRFADQINQLKKTINDLNRRIPELRSRYVAKLSQVEAKKTLNTLDDQQITKIGNVISKIDSNDIPYYQQEKALWQDRYNYRLDQLKLENPDWDNVLADDIFKDVLLSRLAYRINQADDYIKKLNAEKLTLQEQIATLERSKYLRQFEIDELELSLEDINSDLATANINKIKAEADIQKTIQSQKTEEANLKAQAQQQYDQQSAQQRLNTALQYLGLGIMAITGSVSRKKVCLGDKRTLNQETCECECIDPENMFECDGQNVVSDALFGAVIDLDEVRSCQTNCSCGQVAYQFGNDACGCACLGDIVFGTVISGGGSADDHWIDGEGCGCVQKGIFSSRRGKCLSDTIKDKALAQGKRWNGAKCDFECLDGPPADCVGNATRPPQINYGGILIDDECGACVCDGDSFSCNTDEGYVKDTSPGVCDCVYDSVTTENIYLVP